MAVGLVAGVGVAPGSVVGVTVGLVAGVVGVVGVVGVAGTPVVGIGVGLLAGTVGVVGVAFGSVFGVALLPLPLLSPLPLLLVPPALKVALMATPLSSVVTASGSGVFNRPTQFSPLAP